MWLALRMLLAAVAAAAADIRCHERGTCAYNGTFAKQLTYVNQATMCGEEAIQHVQHHDARAP